MLKSTEHHTTTHKPNLSSKTYTSGLLYSVAKLKFESINQR